MNPSDANRRTPRPPAPHVRQQSLRPAELPSDSYAATSTLTGEEFLYHLSRGSELLKENQVQAAKEELEVALSLQPMDLRGQGLLGVVYFRLGLYPRAISIYRQIVAAFDHEIPPKVNLALCYVKTGQHQAARELLEEVVRREPEHLRAWSYLGLAFQFQRDFAKAEAAFERAGQFGMAERVRSMRDGDPLLGEHTIPEVSWEVRAAAREACDGIATATAPFRVDPPANRSADAELGCWCATEPGEEPAALELERTGRRRSSPPPAFPSQPTPELDSSDQRRRDSSNAPTQLHSGRANLAWNEDPTTTNAPGGALAQASARAMPNTDARSNPAHALGSGGAPWPERIHLKDWLSQRLPALAAYTLDRAGCLWVDLSEPFAVKATGIVALSPSEIGKREVRIAYRPRTSDIEELLGGAQAPIIGLHGPGRLAARAQQGVLEAFELDGEALTIRHALLFGLSLALHYDFERLKLAPNESADVVHLYGRGLVVLNLPQPARALDSGPDGLLVRASELAGWSSTLQPETLDPAEAPGRMRGFVLLRGTGTAILT